MKANKQNNCDHAGCWVDIYEDEYYSQDDAYTRIIGPVELPNLENVNGIDWSDQIDSLRVGPNALVKAYEDKNYKDTEQQFGPNQNVPRLDEVNFGDEIDSMIVVCTRCGATTRYQPA